MNRKKKSIFPYIPGYDNNTVLKLIFFISGAYITLAVSWAISMIVYTSADNYNTYFVPFISLPHLSDFSSHWWTLFTHGIFHYAPGSFMELISNMLWLYCFGSVLQMLVGRKQIVPIFLYSILAGGVFYLLAQLLPGDLGKCPQYMLGPRAGLMAICVAAITVSPQYRFYLTETFRVHILVVAGIFAVLMIMGTGFYLPVIAMLLGGGLVGFGYIKLLQAGYRPGEWMYSIGNKLESIATPNEQVINRKQNVRRNIVLNSMQEKPTATKEKRIDALLDKINLKGYNSLSAEERDFLTRAGSE